MFRLFLLNFNIAKIKLATALFYDFRHAKLLKL